MKARSIFYLSLLTTLLAAGQAGAWTQGDLRLGFDDNQVYVGNIQPNARVAIFAACWSDVTPTQSLRIDNTVVRDTDADGVASYAPDMGIPPATLIIAVDMETGAYGFGRPGSRQVREVEIATVINVDDDDRDDDDDAELVLRRASSAHILLVRPNTGFWHALVLDGGELDSDGVKNRVIRVAFEDLYPEDDDDRATKPPRDGQRGDRVFVVDPYQFALQMLVYEGGDD